MPILLLAENRYKLYFNTFKTATVNQTFLLFLIIFAHPSILPFNPTFSVTYCLQITAFVNYITLFPSF